MQTDILAIDFGTSNTAAAVAQNGTIHRIAVEHGSDTLPTAVFFPADRGPMRIGTAAGEALIAGHEGRYMRALKSVLGTPLLHERRMIGGTRRTLAEVVTAFLIELRQRAEAATGTPFRRALSGRPVHFHPDPARDAQAEADLRACYLAAGFTDVTFLAEPEAAAIACQDMGGPEGLGLIVDIGGGTSDFTVFRSGEGAPRILASHGIRLGGTDFDQAVSLAHAMPALGHGGQLRREMGAGLLPVPHGVYVDLATWAKIPFLYTADTRRMVAGMTRLATTPAPMKRLQTVLEDEMGHDLAFAVERGKIAANSGAAPASIDMTFIERGLAPTITRSSLDTALATFRTELQAAASHTLDLAGVSPDAIDRVVLVGGSTLMTFVSDSTRTLCPNARILRSEAFTAVVDGLALAAARKAA